MAIPRLTLLAVAALAAGCGGGGANPAAAASAPVPALQLSAASVDFQAPLGGPSPAGRAIEVRNAGGGALPRPTATVPPPAAGWLSADVAGATPPFTVTVQVAVGALASGLHRGTVTLSAPGAAPVDLAVTLVVAEAGPPVLLAAPAALALSAVSGAAAAAAAEATISDGGQAALPLPSATVLPAGTAWLTASVAGAAAPYALTVQASPAGLLPGTYSASVVLMAAGAAPIEVPVRFTVAGPRTVTITRLLSFWEGGPAPVLREDPDVRRVTLLQDAGAAGPMVAEAVPGAAPGSWSAGAFAGDYWVAIEWAAGTVTWVLASADALDLGEDRGGRADRLPAGPGTTASLEVLGFDPWDFLWNSLELFSWGAQARASYTTSPPLTILDLGTDLVGFTVDWPADMGDLLAPADVLHAVQFRGLFNNRLATLVYERTQTFATATGVSQATGVATAVQASPVAVPTGTGALTADWRRSEFEAAIPAGLLDPAPHRIAIHALQAPLDPTAPLGALGLPLLRAALQHSGPRDPDFHAGSLAYGRHLDAGWSELFSASYGLPVARTAPGATAAAAGLRNLVYRLDEASQAPLPIGPLVGGVVAPTIDGLAAFAPQAGRSTTPTLAWTAPARGAPTSYRLALFRLEAAGAATLAVPLAALVLPASTTSLTLPAGLLRPGQAYVAELTARQSPAEAGGAAPFRTGLPFGEASVWTETFTTAP